MKAHEKPLRIVYGMMGYKRKEELQICNTLPHMMPVVDQFVYVDGSEGTDGTEEWLKEEFPDAPIVVVHNAWSDDFPGQRNQYLNCAAALFDSNEYDLWIIVSDTDEVFSPDLAKNFRKIIEAVRRDNDMLQIRCRSVTIGDDNQRTYENIDDFHKPLCFRYYPGMQYWGDRSAVTGNTTALHEALMVDGRFVWRPRNLNDQDGRFLYEHIKTREIVWERGLRNFVVMGGGPNLGERQPLWLPFRQMMSELMDMPVDSFSYHDVLDYMRKGNIDDRLRQWLIDHRNEDGYDGASEVRECFYTYFIYYHPEELPEELREEYNHMLTK